MVTERGAVSRSQPVPRTAARAAEQSGAWGRCAAKETVHLQVLQSPIHEELQFADTRTDAHRRAAVFVRYLRESVQATGSFKGPSVSCFFSTLIAT